MKKSDVKNVENTVQPVEEFDWSAYALDLDKDEKGADNQDNTNAYNDGWDAGYKAGEKDAFDRLEERVENAYNDGMADAKSKLHEIEENAYKAGYDDGVKAGKESLQAEIQKQVDTAYNYGVREGYRRHKFDHKCIGFQELNQLFDEVQKNANLLKSFASTIQHWHDIESIKKYMAKYVDLHSELTEEVLKRYANFRKENL